MNRQDEKKIEQLAKKNAAKAKKQIDEEGNNLSPKKKERLDIDRELDDRDSTQLFREMKRRSF
jgi:ABC-type transport system involved in cytochrome bd biosynthesis fused ATPase/permease subunit